MSFRTFRHSGLVWFILSIRIRLCRGVLGCGTGIASWLGWCSWGRRILGRALGGVFGVVVGVGAFSCECILLIDKANLNSNFYMSNI